eukprot:227360_1
MNHNKKKEKIISDTKPKSPKPKPPKPKPKPRHYGQPTCNTSGRFHFMNCMKTQYAKNYPNSQKRSIQMRNDYRCLDDSQKQPYVQMAEADRARHIKTIIEWKRTENYGKYQKALAQWESEQTHQSHQKKKKHKFPKKKNRKRKNSKNHIKGANKKQKISNAGGQAKTNKSKYGSIDDGEGCKDIDMKDIECTAFVIPASFEATAENRGTIHNNILCIIHSSTLDAMIKYLHISEILLYKHIIEFLFYIDYNIQSFKPNVWSSSILKQPTNYYAITNDDGMNLQIRPRIGFGTSKPAHIIGHELIGYNDDYSLEVEITLNWNSAFSLGICNNYYLNSINKHRLDTSDENMLRLRGGYGISIESRNIKMYKNSNVTFETEIGMKDEMKQNVNNQLKASVTMVISAGYMFFVINGKIVGEGIKLSSVGKFAVVICGLNAQNFKINSNRE